MQSMIRPIMKKDYDQKKLLEGRKFFGETTVFKGADGKYYECDKRGAAAIKEVFKKQAQLKKNINDQTSLLSDPVA